MKKYRLIPLLLALVLTGCNNRNTNSIEDDKQNNTPSQTNDDKPAQYIVTFDTDGAGSINPQEITKGSTAIRPDDPTKDGYTFVGWYLGNAEYDFTTPVEGNITLVAHWEEVVVEEDYIAKVKLSEHSDFTTYENTTFANDGIGLVTVDYVEDGDTVSFNEGDASLLLRMSFIDTPEDDEPWAHEAAQFVRAILGQSKTIVITNTLLSSQEPADLDSTGERYLGIIWYSFKENAALNDLRCLNLEIVYEGYSKNRCNSGYELANFFAYCQSAAQQAKRRIWENYVAPHNDYGYNHYNGYYGELTWENGEDLKEKLHDIISQDVNYLRYDGSPANWETNIDADHSYDNLDMLDVVYSTIDVAKEDSQKSWQREHAFVASLMTGATTSAAVTTKQGRAVDFHNLFASSSNGNQSRSDKNFGKANPNADTYKETEGYKYDSQTFEPNDEDKGRLARAIFYMTVMYSVEETEGVKMTLNYNATDAAIYGQASKTVNIPITYKPLTVVEEPVPNAQIVSYTNYYYHTTDELTALVNQYGEGEVGYGKYVQDTCKYAIGHFTELLSWTYFPVDIQEYQHNESVYSHVHSTQQVAQNNRNPFVDYPELIDYVYGSKKDSAGDLKYLVPTSYRLGLEESGLNHYAVKDLTTEYEVGDTFDKSCYTLMGVNNDFTLVNAPNSADLTTSYVFKDSDIGTKKMTIETDKNPIDVQLTVKEKEEEFSYRYVYSGDKSDFGSGDYEAGVARNITLNGVSWSATAQHTANISNKNSPLSVQIGNGTTKCAEKFTLVSGKTFTNVNKIKIISNCAASPHTCTVKVKVGDALVTSYTVTGSSTTHTERDIAIDPKLSGVVTIEFSDLDAALYINTIAINEVN